MTKFRILVAAVALAGAIAGCGGAQDVSHDGPGGGPGENTPTPTPTATPGPKDYAVHVNFDSIHVYVDGDPIFQGELYCTLAVNDTVHYSTKITTGNPSDVDLSSYGVTAIDVHAKEGDPFYIYADCYDQDPNNYGSDPLGTVNTGWYAADSMIGQHTVAAANPYYYNLTYTISVAN
jgi:hypothetical protein